LWFFDSQLSAAVAADVGDESGARSCNAGAGGGIYGLVMNAAAAAASRSCRTPLLHLLAWW